MVQENKSWWNNSSRRRILFKRVGSGIFYAVVSFLITVINKTILTTFKFPSFQVLAFGQMMATVIILFFAKRLRVVDFPALEKNTFMKIFPLPVIHIGNMIFGLGGTKELSLPMFTALRRFTILMTMILEYYILDLRPSTSVQFSVFAMVGGALIAASDDLAFDPDGYLFVMLSDLFTSTHGVYIKQILESKELGKYGLMYYNSFFMVLPAFLIAYMTGDVAASFKYQGWNDILFLIQFFLSCVMGFALSYSIVLCTHYNSALTTTVIGCLKNIFVTYLGMVIGGDYIFSIINFIGLNISVVGSLVYTYVTLKTDDSVEETVPHGKQSKQVEIV